MVSRQFYAASSDVSNNSTQHCHDRYKLSTLDPEFERGQSKVRFLTCQEVATECLVTQSEACPEAIDPSDDTTIDPASQEQKRA